MLPAFVRKTQRGRGGRDPSKDPAPADYQGIQRSGLRNEMDYVRIAILFYILMNTYEKERNK